MTLKIEVVIPEDEIRSGASTQYLNRAMAALGFGRGMNIDWKAAMQASEPVPGKSSLTLDEAVRVAEETSPAVEPEDDEAVKTIRYHGQPSPGGKRRTKAEITLDEEAADLLEDVGLTVAKFNAALDKAGGDWDAVMADLRAAAAPKDEAPASNISTGEERVDPAAEEDDEGDEPLAHDDVRAALGDYAAKFGMPAAQKNGPKLMGADKISAIPDDQAALRAAVEAIRGAIEKGQP